MGSSARLHAQAQRRAEEAHRQGAAYRDYPPHLWVLDGG